MKHQHKNPLVAEYHDIIKPDSDNKNYRGLVLVNKLKVLLTSDPTAEKAAASMSVAVGSMNDPPHVPGLAHLCEHMLFIETTKTNGGKGYSKFISENGGGCNAFTTRDQTNYYFDIAASAFNDALTRFSKFFTTPPEFPDNALQQELKIVTSEHENKLTNEAWRKMAVEAVTAKPGHPFGQFSTGNEETLWVEPNAQGINVLECLRNFHSQFYSASIMSLVVLSKEPLDYLEELVVNLFSGVKNLNIATPSWPNNPYGPVECQKWIDIVPLSEVRDLYVCFPMPDSRPWFKTFPHGYLTNLLGHKGPGSVFSLLSRNEWVNNTYLNSSVPGRGFGYLTIGLTLTVEGLKHVEEIVEIVFSYIGMLQSKGPQKYFWQELKDILKIQFDFIDCESGIDFVQRTSNLLHVYPMSEILTIGYILDNFDEGVIKKFLSSLTPEFCRIMVVAKKNDAIATQTEKWYGVKYQVQPINPSLINKWKEACTDSSKYAKQMTHPPKNLFIPTKFDLKYIPQPEMQTEPRRISQDQLIKAWFYQDCDLTVPKAFIRFELYSFLPMVDPFTYNCNHILSMMFKESIAEELYSAILAGLNYTIKGTMYGMEITVDGYDERLTVLTETILQRLLDFDPNSNMFKAKLESYENGLINSSNLQPYTQIPYYFSLLTREKRFTDEELLTSLKELTADAIPEYHKLFMKRLNLECLIYGNLSENEAIHCCVKWKAKFQNFGTKPLIPSQSIRLREVQLPAGTSWVYKKMLGNENQRSCCAVLFQVGSRRLEDNVLLELFDQVIYEPCFNQLRNQEQLGYIVRSSVRKSNGTQGLLIIVQGLLKPQLVHARIESFFNNLKGCLQAMQEDILTRHKSAVALRKTDLPKKLLTRANRLWNHEIYTREYNFTRNKDEIMFLQTLDANHLISFYNKYFNPASEDRKCISIYLESPTSQGTNPTIRNNSLGTLILHQEITDVTDWKSNMTLSPLFPILKSKNDTKTLR